MFHPRICRILIGYQMARLAKNVPALMLIGLLVALALLLSSSRPPEKPPTIPCWVVYWEESPWIEHLKKNVPRDQPILVIHESKVPRKNGELVYPRPCHAIQILPREGDEPQKVVYLYSGPDRNAIWPYANWFWAMTRQHHWPESKFIERQQPMGGQAAAGGVPNMASATAADLMNVESIGSVLVFFALFFTCVHLLVSATSQEREQGTLLALALTPASMLDMLLAKVSFYLALALITSAMVIAALKPAALAQPVLWMALGGGGLAYIGLGLSIAALFRTQATAGLMTLSYMLVVGVVFYLSQKYPAFAQLEKLLGERYVFSLVYVAMQRSLGWMFPQALLWLFGIAAVWLLIAAKLFSSRGWK